MKTRIRFLFLLFVLTGCSQITITTAPAANEYSPTPTLADATNTPAPPTITPTVELLPWEATNTVTAAYIQATSAAQLAKSSQPRPTDAPATNFHYDDGVTAADRKLIEDGVVLGKKYWGDIWNLDVFADTNSQALCSSYMQFNQRGQCNAVDSDYLAFVSEYGVFIKVYENDWQRASPGLKTEVVVHEYFHIVQNYLAGRRSHGYVPRDIGPIWLVEGSADYAAVSVLAREKLYDVEMLRDHAILEARQIRAPLKNLQTKKDALTAGKSSEYTLGLVAVDFMLQNYGGPENLVKFYDNLGLRVLRETAFFETFGIRLDEFYDKFEEHRKKNFPPFIN